MIGIVFNFLTMIEQLNDGKAIRQKIVLLISLTALLFSACSPAAEEVSAPLESQAPDTMNAPEPTATVIKPQILFTSMRDGKSEIYIMNADGTDERQLSNSDIINPGEGSVKVGSNNPAWSPDGQQIVFSFEGQTFVMNADGSDSRQLTEENGRSVVPSWSPDGQHIAFMSTRDGDAEIWVMNVDGTDVHQLTDNSIRDSYPAWSPDGQTIAYHSDFPFAVYLMNADGGDKRLLIEGKEGYGWDPAWSPDGKQIAFVSVRDGDDEIFVVNVDGSDVRQVTDSPDHDGSPAWSADGLQLAFTSDRDGDFEVYVMNVDGSDVRQLTDNDVLDQDPVWSSIP